LPALLVHGGHTLGQVPVARLERRGAAALDDDGGAARVGAVDLAARGGAVLLDGAEEALGEEVRVDVDALGVGHGADSTIEPAAAAPGFPHPMSLGPPGGESGATPHPWLDGNRRGAPEAGEQGCAGGD